MPTPKEEVLEACYQIAQVNHVAPAIESKWGWIFHLEILYLHHGDIQFEEDDEKLPVCLEILMYSLTKQKDPVAIAWHQEHINMANDDTVILGNARETIATCKSVITKNQAIFDDLVSVCGNPGNKWLHNAVLVGKWESDVREIMEKHKKSHREAEVIIVLQGKIQK